MVEDRSLDAEAGKRNRGYATLAFQPEVIVGEDCSTESPSLLISPRDARESEVCDTDAAADASSEDHSSAQNDASSETSGSEEMDAALAKLESEVVAQPPSTSSARPSGVPFDPSVIGRQLCVFLLRCVCAFAALIVAWCAFGDQILSAAEKELAKNPYSAIPLTKLAKPFSKDMPTVSAYVRALQCYSIGLISEVSFTAAPPNGLAFERCLRELEKLGDDGAALRAYAQVHLGGADVAVHNLSEQSEQNLLSAITSAADSINPESSAVAAAQRHAAQYYIQNFSKRPYKLSQARQWLESAIALDTRGAGAVSQAMVENHALMAALKNLQHDLPAGDLEFSRYCELTKNVYGAQSFRYARSLFEFAAYLSKTGRMAESVTHADDAATILLSSGNKIEWQGFIPVSATDGGAFYHYLKNVHQLDSSRSESLRLSINSLDHKFLSWHSSKSTPRRHFDLLVKFADEYHEGKNFAQADRLYKTALQFASTKAKTGFSSNRSSIARTLDQNIIMSDWYVLCMAKASRNARDMGNLQEAVSIADNCIKLMNPLNHWRGNYDYSPAVEQLIYAFGPAKETLRTAAEARVIRDLASLLESLKLSGYPGLRSQKSAWLLLSEFWELQGNLKEAEACLQIALQNRKTSVTYGALGAFYLNHGREKEGLQLLVLAERHVVAPYRKASSSTVVQVYGKGQRGYGGTMINNARLKYIFDSCKINNALDEFEWIRDTRKYITSAQTSAQLGMSFSIWDFRPVVRDYRTKQAAGFAYNDFDARADLMSLSKERQEIARRLFKWSELCLSEKRSASYPCVLRESLSAVSLPGIQSLPYCAADLVPAEVFILDEEDREKLHQLLGRAHTSSSSIRYRNKNSKLPL